MTDRSTNGLVLQVLTETYERRGELTPAIVVEEARDVDHPLHSRFEWDNDKAAEQYRLVQAGALIRSVKLKIVDPEPSEIRAFINVSNVDPSRGSGRYVPQEEVAVDPILQRVVLQSMRRDWLLMRRRYEKYSEFWAMVSADNSGRFSDADERIPGSGKHRASG